MRRALIAAIAIGLCGAGFGANLPGGTGGAAFARAPHPAPHRVRCHVVRKRSHARRLHRVLCRRRHGPARGGSTPGAGVGAPTTPSATTPVADPPTAALPSRLGVDEQEYSIYPSHNPVAAGSVQFNVANFGQDDHNLTISWNGSHVAHTQTLPPGGQETLTVNLQAGTYKLYCSLYDHDQLGMHATLVVR